MLPSLYASGDGARAWSLARAAAYGAGIGALAALVKIFAIAAGRCSRGAVLGIGEAPRLRSRCFARAPPPCAISSHGD